MTRGLALRSQLVLLAAVAAVAVRVPWIASPLSPDEGGFLLIAGQWHSGSGSLYGAYWVDRPPLLIALFAIADLLGGTVPLRLLGCVAAAASVLLAARLGRLVCGERCIGWCALGAAAFVSMPLFDARQVSGELLGTPFVMAGLVLFLGSRAAARPRSRWWLAVAAGAFGAASFLIKQNFMSVFVFVACFLLAELFSGGVTRSLLRDLVAFATGAFAAMAAAIAGAAALGTSPVGLWDAVVIFRAQATHVIASSASSATTERLHRYPMALAVSGALLILLLFAVRLATRRGPSPLMWATVGLIGWEVFAVVGGGSYWLHYLLTFIPGLVLAIALLVRVRDRVAKFAKAAAGYAAVTAMVATAMQVLSPAPASNAQVAGEWLKDHTISGDTAVVIYGQPNVLAEAGLTSPYPDLWSLPIRVRDSDLHKLSALLRSERAPEWLLVGNSLATWGINSTRVRHVVQRHYRHVADVCGFRVFLRDGVYRSHATTWLPPRCIEVRPGGGTQRFV